MSQRRRRKRQKQLRHDHPVGLGHKRMAVGTGLSVGAALGMTATAEATDFTVSNTNSTGSGSLAQAMSDAFTHPGLDRIFFSGLSGTIGLTSDLTAVDQPLEVHGPGANVLTISGNNAHRIFNVTSGGDMIVSGLTMTNGNPSGSGGAVLNSSGTVTIQDSNISGNTGYGGGIFSAYGTLTVQRSTISGNNTYGIRTRYDDDTIQDSTIAGNTSAGVRVSHESPDIQNSTISGNTGSGIFAFYSGVYLTSTVVANSGAGSDIYNYFGTSAFSADFSLIEDDGGNTLTGSNNITGADPALGGLAFNGGPTPTMRPSNTSLLLDKGSGTGTDQRGQPRPFDIASIPNVGNGADIGAVELQAADLAPPAAAPTPAGPTGLRAKAIKRCKKKFPKGPKRKKCIRKAKRLPV
jgi:Right handed beta helix region